MTTIYAGDADVLVKLDTAVSLTYATVLEIHVTRPDGVADTWTATRDGTTQVIQYTTISGDLDIPGIYILRSYLEFSSRLPHTGDPVELSVNASTDSTGLISMFRVLYRYISLRDMPYQNFAVYYDLAVDEHAINLVTYGNPSMTTSQTNAALCHLIADYFEKGNPDWTYSSQTISPGVSFSRSQLNGNVKTSARKAYEDMMNGIVSARTASTAPYFHYTPPVFSKGMMDIEPPSTTTEIPHTT